MERAKRRGLVNLNFMIRHCRKSVLLTAMFWVLVFLVGTVDHVITPAMSFHAQRTC